jgi:hypothetical protein
LQHASAKLEAWRASFANLDFDAAYGRLVEALRADPVYAWHEIVRNHSGTFARMLYFRSDSARRAEMVALLEQLYLGAPEMIAIPARGSDPVAIQNTRSKRADNINKGLPYFLMATQGKSGSAAFGGLVPNGFGLTCTTYSMINVTVIPSWARDFARGGASYNTHLLPSPENIDRMVAAGLTRVIVHVRDPRQVFLSTLHHYDRYREDYPDKLKSGFYTLTLGERALLDLSYYDEEIVAWIAGWVDAEKHGLTILYTTFEQYLHDRTRTIERILEFYGADTRYFNWDQIVSSDPSIDYHFRLGQVDEWRTALGANLIDVLNARIPESWFERFGWERQQERQGKERGTSTSVGAARISSALSPDLDGDTQSFRENGCLRVLSGSHKLGRIEHIRDESLDGSFVGPERLEVIKTKCPEVYVELNVGDFVIFHCNTLHGSDENRSIRSRIALLGCYNTKRNSPYKATKKAGHPFYQDQRAITARVTAADVDRMPDFELKCSQ